ncbi:heptaprenylglyceryl phosphate synthase [Paenactinomyces guangxiensis]|uniref:Heptaprenylglyceryl phosphate synthase n=1 Tax=Paenactinomyces guangxiensis TaxID=1490290 RepID=A0A7W1WRM1_9BACL|nr:heptaprenylglyceryl phosphate synthase [Paenactinomyces guangxiensis]MBA4494796.1 heptaprenylglyceryl phosphate synthase [Paenactinomyces guangxiensis]MBH8591879.1 heptaprenylglyceryl phosphate synthase [Paenactinomyces guangxiensis]
MLHKLAATWRHIFKLDPDRKLSDLALQKICESGTDAIVVGGTDNVTFKNTWELFQRLKKFPITCVQEISTASAIVPGFDGYLIPSVLNTDNAYWIHGAHHEALKKYGEFAPWEHIVFQGYVILNPEAKVSRLTRSRTELDPEDVTAYARIAEHLYRMPVFYMEYSGKFGDVEMVKAARKGLKNTRLFYGGGIRSEEQAKMMAEWADTVVVGNVIYTHVEMALRTVRWVKETKRVGSI